MRLDILKDDENNIMIANGDFATGQSDQQHVKDIIVAFPGEYKSNPIVGFGALRYIKSNVDEERFKRDLKIQLNYDGYSNAVIDLSEGFENLKVEI